MELKDLEIYRLAQELSKEVWVVYDKFDWQTKKITGDQWISAVDSVGANIAEGFGRFHYLDKNKFNYNARGSLHEAVYWSGLLFERDKITKEFYDKLIKKLEKLKIKLNSYIQSTKRQIK